MSVPERPKESRQAKPAISSKINARETLARVRAIFLVARCNVGLTEGAPVRGSKGMTKINLFVSVMNRRFAEIAFSPRDTRSLDDFQFVSFRPAVPLPRAHARNGYTYIRGLLVFRLAAFARGRLARIANQIECAPLQRRLHCADDVRTRYIRSTLRYVLSLSFSVALFSHRRKRQPFSSLLKREEDQHCWCTATASNKIVKPLKFNIFC